MSQLDEKRSYEVVHKNGVLIREAPGREARILGRLACSQRVQGRLSGLWLQLADGWSDSLETKPQASTAWVLVDGKEIGLGTLLALSDSTAADPSHLETEASGEAEKDTRPEFATDRAESHGKPVPNVQEDQLKDRETKGKAARAVKHASTLAEQVVEPVEYSVLSPKLPLYSEPRAASERREELEGATSIHGYPGSLSWLRLARQPETWAPIKSAKEIFLSPKWSQLTAENVFSEALEVSWNGLVARSPYVAAYSIEWRLTPGEELPIGHRNGSKKSGYALSLTTRTKLI